MAQNEASVTLWTECDHFRPSIRNSFMKVTKTIGLEPKDDETVAWNSIADIIELS